MRALLNDLTALSKGENSRVALRARQVLIAANQPPYELRHNQVESIFLSAIDFFGHKYNPENLQVRHVRVRCVEKHVETVAIMFQKLILSETSIYDVLHDFFYHTNKLVCAAALEVGLSAKKLFPRYTTC